MSTPETMEEVNTIVQQYTESVHLSKRNFQDYKKHKIDKSTRRRQNYPPQKLTAENVRTNYITYTIPA